MRRFAEEQRPPQPRFETPAPAQRDATPEGRDATLSRPRRDTYEQRDMVAVTNLSSF